MTRLLLALCSAFLVAGPTAAEDDSGFSLSGWREVVVTVASIEAHQTFFEEVGAWESRTPMADASDQMAFWGVPEVEAKEIVIANPGTATGMIRLVEVAGSHPQIRSNSQLWDTGGILDINIRVTDMETKFNELQRRGWQAAGDPVRFTFGPFEVTEWITRGPDGLTFALIERHKPTLEGWPHLKDFSRAFNATQVVDDLEPSLSFYRDVLGFKKYLSHSGASSGDGSNVLGLPKNLAKEIVRDIWIGHPQGINEGSVELLAFQGVEGRDFSKQAVPPNIGMLSLRFPVTGLDAFIAHLQRHDVPIETAPTRMQLAPYGAVRMMAITAPNGSRLEFFEVTDATAG
jgi:catechol 2,3-dioxygenase-like lactoylglutathione lyase family enzyme